MCYVHHCLALAYVNWQTLLDSRYSYAFLSQFMCELPSFTHFHFHFFIFASPKHLLQNAGLLSDSSVQPDGG